MRIVLLTDRNTGAVGFWYDHAEYHAYYDVIQSVWQARQHRLVEQIYDGPVPDEWDTMWPLYELDANGSLLFSRRLSIESAYYKTSIAGRELVVTRIANHRHQIRQLATVGLPTTLIGYIKFQQSINLAHAFLSNGCSEVDRQSWLTVCSISYPDTKPETAAKGVLALSVLASIMARDFVEKGFSL